MKAVTQAELEGLVVGAVDARPITAGTITSIIRMTGVDVNRSSVVAALKRLRDQKRVGAIYAPCTRNGQVRIGQHWYDVDEFARTHMQDDDGDPFDGLTA